MIALVDGDMKPSKVILSRDSQGKITRSAYLMPDGSQVPDDHKYCPACSTLKLKTEFSKAGNACRPCALERARLHRLKRREDPEYVDSFNHKRREELRVAKAKAVQEMGGKCQDCGGVFHQSAYDFHHLDPSVKDDNPSRLLRTSKGREELKKCVLLCANCHRLRHFTEEPI